MLVSHHTIYCHTRLTAFHSETGAALTDGDVHMPYIGAIQTVMGQHMEILFVGIQSEDARALSAAEVNCLGGDDLQNFVQVERRSNDRRNTMYGSEFMHFAS